MEGANIEIEIAAWFRQEVAYTVSKSMGSGVRGPTNPVLSYPSFVILKNYLMSHPFLYTMGIIIVALIGLF